MLGKPLPMVGGIPRRDRPAKEGGEQKEEIEQKGPDEPGTRAVCDV